MNMPVLSLPALAEQLGFPLKKQGKSWGGAKCPVCGEGAEGSTRLCVFPGKDGRWRYKCFACGDAGDSIDFLARAHGVTLAKAVRLAREMASSTTSTSTPQSAAQARKITSPPPPQQSADPKRLEALREVLGVFREKADVSARVRRYLYQRGIGPHVQEEARKRGILRGLPGDTPMQTRQWLSQHVGDDLLVKAGLKKPDGWSALAFRPLVFLMQKSVGLEARQVEASEGHAKAIRYGELDSPWWWLCEGGAEKTRELIMVEGAIDVLAVAQIGLRPGLSAMGIPGVNGWRESWIRGVAERLPGVRVFVGLDNDAAGDAASKAIAEKLQALGVRCARSRPKVGKDWADALAKQ